MREYVTIFLVALVVTYLLCVIAREIATRTGAVARVRQRDMHEVPVPYFGGLAMCGGLAAAYFLARELPFLSQDPFVLHDAWVVLVAGAMICLLGAVDDLFELDPLIKLLGQILAAAFLVANQVSLYLVLPLPGGGQFSMDDAQAALLTIVLVVATVNAVNFVDGLDGLAAGIVGIGAVAFFAFSYDIANINKQSLAITAALLCAALAGACAGFLPHNIFPARDVHGRLGLDAARSRVGRLRAHPDRPVRHGGHELGGERLLVEPAAGDPAGDPADHDPDRAVRGPRDRSRTPHVGRPVAVLAGQAAPASPARGDRAFAPPGGADHVGVGGVGVLRGGGDQPLPDAADLACRGPGVRDRGCGDLRAAGDQAT
ncbi:MAG: MraY family glycosyltransferase, partial [Nocardioidaceae bacterium]